MQRFGRNLQRTYLGKESLRYTKSYENMQETKFRLRWLAFGSTLATAWRQLGYCFFSGRNHSLSCCHI